VKYSEEPDAAEADDETQQEAALTMDADHDPTMDTDHDPTMTTDQEGMIAFQHSIID
jgi:hypothetical protein